MFACMIDQDATDPGLNAGVLKNSLIHEPQVCSYFLTCLLEPTQKLRLIPGPVFVNCFSVEYIKIIFPALELTFLCQSQNNIHAFVPPHQDVRQNIAELLISLLLHTFCLFIHRQTAKTFHIICPLYIYIIQCTLFGDQHLEFSIKQVRDKLFLGVFYLFIGSCHGITSGDLSVKFTKLFETKDEAQVIWKEFQVFPEKKSLTRSN